MPCKNVASKKVSEIVQVWCKTTSNRRYQDRCTQRTGIDRSTIMIDNALCSMHDRWQNSKSISKKVYPLAAEKAAEYSPSAPPIESYTHLTPMPITEILAKKQRRLEEWDRDLRRREHALVVLKTPKRVTKNWPKIFPLIYHDISVAIPVESQALIQFAYWTWKLTAAAYIFNWFLLTIA